MRRAMLLLAVTAIIGIFTTGCGITTVEPGHVGIKVNMWGGDRGVQNLPIVTGRVVYNPITTRVFEYPTFVQTGIWTADERPGSEENEEVTFNSIEGLIIGADVSLSYQLQHEQVPAFYVKFRSDNLETFTHGYLRNIARDAFNEIASRYTAEALYGEKKEEYLQTVRDRINEQIKQYAHLEQLGFIGAPRLPKQVVEALNMKIQATQNAMTAENQLRQTEAEARKTVAAAEGQAQAQIALAQAQAEANRLVAESITPRLLAWRQWEVMENKWTGEVPKIVSGDQRGMPFLMQINPEQWSTPKQ